MNTNKNAVFNDHELSQVANADRLLPNQEILKKLYSEDEADYFNRLEKVILGVQEKKSVEQKFDFDIKPGFTYASMGADLGTLYFYQFLVRSCNFKSVLELGPYIGVSSLFWSEAVGEDGHVTTIELGDEFANIALSNFEKNKAKNIELIKDNALNALDYFAKNGKKFDCVYIDAAKQIYDVLFQKSMACLNAGGIILIDDVLFQGETLNDEIKTNKGLGVERCLELARQINGEKSLLPIGNGLLLIRPTTC